MSGVGDPLIRILRRSQGGGMQTTTNHDAATAMTQNLAEQVTAKLNAPGLEATVGDLFADGRPPTQFISDSFGWALFSA